jgi:hypothetical protein
VAESIEEALVELRLPQLSNLATRFLCGDPSPMNELPPNALDNAKANLCEFAFVGLQERFDESVVLLQRMLGLDLIPYMDRHTSIERPAVEEISERERALIAEHNRLDAELYAFARELFDQAVASTHEGLEADAERLRALSENRTDEALRLAGDWLDREFPVGSELPKAELVSEAVAAGVSPAAVGDLAGKSVDRERRDGQVIWRRIADTDEQPS